MDVRRPGDLRDVTHQTRGARVEAASAINPVCSAKNQPDVFDEIFSTRAFFRKYLKEKCQAEPNQQFSLKSFF